MVECVPKKKILMVINRLAVGGAERQVIDDYNELYSLGNESVLLTLRPEKEESLGGELISKEHWHTIPFSGFFDVSSWRKLLCFLKKEKPDIVLSHLWFANSITRISSVLAGVKNVFVFEQNIYDSIKSPKQFLLDRLLQKWTRKIIAVSGAVKGSLLRHGINENKIIVLHNSVDLERFEGLLDVDIQNFKDEYNLNDSFIITTIGRLTRQKNMKLAMDALALVSNAKLLIVGIGELEGELMEYAERVGVSDRVLFMGVRSDIPVILLASDCFLLTSLFEGLGIVILEAMAAGLPVVVTDFEVVYELVRHQETGMIAVYEAEIIAQYIKDIQKDDVLRANLGLHAKDAVQKFSSKAHARRLLDIMESNE